MRREKMLSGTHRPRSGNRDPSSGRRRLHGETLAAYMVPESDVSIPSSMFIPSSDMVDDWWRRACPPLCVLRTRLPAPVVQAPDCQMGRVQGPGTRLSAGRRDCDGDDDGSPEAAEV